MDAYKTAEECRAHVNGTVTATMRIKKLLGEQWVLGRDEVDINRLRDELLAIETEQGAYIKQAQEFEVEKQRQR